MQQGFRELIDAMRSEGSLLRDDGYNSIADIKIVGESIESQITEQSYIIQEIADGISEMNAFNVEQSEDFHRNKRVGGEGGDDYPMGKPVTDDRINIPPLPIGVEEDVKGISMFASLFGSLGTTAGSLIAPLKGVLSVVGKGGLVFTAIYLAYNTFKDIGDNPEFTSALTKVRLVWNEKVLPTIQKLGAFFSNLFGGDSETITSSLLAIPNNFKMSIQRFVSDTISNFAGIIGESIDGISLLLDGQFLAGIHKIFNGAVSGIVTLFDDAVSGILGIFGVDFGPDGSLLKSIGDTVDGVSDQIAFMWASVGNFIQEKWGLVGDTISSMFSKISDPIVNGVENVWNVISDVFTFSDEDKTLLGGLGKIQDIVFIPVNAAINLIRGMFKFDSTDSNPFKIQDFVNGSLGSAVSWVSNTFNGIAQEMKSDFNQFGEFLAGIPTQIWNEAERMYINVGAKLRKGFLVFGDWFGSIPDQVKLMALETINSVRGGSWLVDDDEVASARSKISARGSDLSNQLADVEEQRLRSIDALTKKAAESNSNTNDISSNVNSGNRTDSRRYNTTHNTFIQGSSPQRFLDPALPQ